MNSQGGVKVPTGGMGPFSRARERSVKAEVSRSGEMPGPTVIVRMKENEILAASALRSAIGLAWGEGVR